MTDSRMLQLIHGVAMLSSILAIKQWTIVDVIINSVGELRRAYFVLEDREGLRGSLAVELHPDNTWTAKVTDQDGSNESPAVATWADFFYQMTQMPEG